MKRKPANNVTGKARTSLGNYFRVFLKDQFLSISKKLIVQQQIMVKLNHHQVRR
jgi:hypothetical protein